MQYQRIGFHLVFWMAILIWRTNGDFFGMLPYEKFFWKNLMRLPIMVLTTYGVIYYLLPRFILREKKYVLFAILLGVTLIAATFLDQWLIQSNLMKNWLQPLTHRQYKLISDLHPYRNSFSLLSIIGIASLIRFFKIYVEEEKKKNALIQENLETQYAFLKAQVNPHFLFNTLNNLYSMAVRNEQKDIALGIENLSGIMQYLTYESKALKVPLTKEVDLLNNYIEIEQLRFEETEDTTISFQVEGNFKNKEIAPVILLPLVENAFKHGIRPDEKCLLSFELEIDDEWLQFRTKNRYFEREEKTIREKGIGLENVRKRLELRYPEKHSLKCEKKGDNFVAELKIKI